MNSAANTTSVPLIRINCLLDKPSPIESLYTIEKHCLLAVARSDNSIEIWDTSTWIQLIKIPGTGTNQIRRVFMTIATDVLNIDNLRVFTIGMNGFLIEWNLLTCMPKFYYKNPGGCIWDCHLKGKVLLLASDDGSPRTVRIKKNIDPVLVKQFMRTDSKILSVIWENTKTQSEVFYTGHSNGLIMKWNSQSGNILLTLNMSNTASDLMIWALCSVDTFLISGDSSGRLMIWDTQYGILNKEFKEHNADILAICQNNYSTTPCAYYTGSDSLVCSVLYTNNEWTLTSKFRGQSHDINSLAMLNQNFILSGGLTSDICIYKLFKTMFYQKYDKKISTSIKRHISPFEHKSKVYYCKQSNGNIFILHRELECLNLWLVNAKNDEKFLFLAKIKKSNKSDSHILSANISQSGKWISYSDAENTVIFSYDFEKNEVKKIKTLRNLQSKFLFFTRNEEKLISVNQVEKCVQVYCISKEIFEVYKISENVEYFLSCDVNTDDENKICISMSTMSKKLILVHLDKSRKEEQGVIYLPHCDNYITQLKFLSSSSLLSVAEDNKLYIIDLNSRRYDKWTNLRIENMDYPKNYMSWYNKIMGVAVISPKLFLLYTDYNYIKVDLCKEIPENSIIEKNRVEKYRHSDWDKKVKELHSDIFNNIYHNLKGKSKENAYTDAFGKEREDKDNRFMWANDNFKITSRFSSILFLDYLEDSSVFVIENDWTKIMKSFPEAVVRFKYGQ